MGVLALVMCLIGIWAAVAPFLFPWDVCAWVWAAGIVPGVLVALMSIWFAASTPKKRWAWLGWVCAVLGVWLIVSPLVAGYRIVSDVTWSNFVPGALIALLGTVTGWQAQAAE
jgi:hypothetical protein